MQDLEWFHKIEYLDNRKLDNDSSSVFIFCLIDLPAFLGLFSDWFVGDLPEIAGFQNQRPPRLLLAGKYD